MEKISLATVKYLVDECNFDPETQNLDEKRPVHIAAENGDLEILKYLVEEKNCEINVEDDNNWTPFLYAAKNGHLDVLRYLAEKGAEVTAQDKSNQSALHVAGTVEVVKFLVEKGLKPASLDEEYPLVLSAYSYGHVDVAKYFIDKCGVKGDTKDEIGRTPLHYAGTEEAAKYLVEKCHCSIEDGDRYGLTPVFTALSGGRTEVLRYFKKAFNVEFDYNDDNLGEYVKGLIKENHLSTFKFLFEECGVKIEGDDEVYDLMTSLIKKGRLDFIKCFVEKGIYDPKQIRGEQGNALHLTIACYKEKTAKFIKPILKYFIDTCHCDVNAKTADGNTPLHIAVAFEVPELVKYLIECHCDKGIKNNEGKTALELNESENEEIANLLA